MQTFKNPIFQKRHYEFIADILKDILPHLVAMQDMRKASEKFADKFIKISPKNDDGKPLFDKKKFLDRIGVKWINLD